MRLHPFGMTGMSHPWIQIATTYGSILDPRMKEVTTASADISAKRLIAASMQRATQIMKKIDGGRR
jgi:hypothetical protein